MQGISSDNGFLLRVEKGALLPDAIVDFAKRHNIQSASLLGIGAVSGVEIGYFHADKKEYDKRTLSGEYELIQMAGNISMMDNAPFVHAHVVLGDADFGCLSGHLFAAEVAVTAEIHLLPLGPTVIRSPEPEIGVALLQLPEI